MQLLKGKNALIFGAKGALGKQVAKEFKSHGANLYLTDINVKGESEETDLGTVRKLDTLDEKQIEAYFSWFNMEKVVVDIVINCSGTHHSEFKHGEPSSLLSADQFLIPLRNMTASQFLTAKYAAGAMTPNKSGVIIFITSTVARVGAPFTTALTASHAATEGIVRCLASEWGPAGIRVLGVR